MNVKNLIFIILNTNNARNAIIVAINVLELLIIIVKVAMIQMLN